VLYWYKSTNTDAKGAAGVNSEDGHLKRDLNSDIARNPSRVLITDLNTDLNSDLNRDLNRDLDRDLNSDLNRDLNREEAARQRGEEASHVLSTVRHALRQFVCDIEGVLDLQHEVFEGVVAGFEAQLEEAKADAQRARERERERERERARAEAGALQRADAADEARDVEPASEEASEGYALAVRQYVYFCTSKASKARRLPKSEGEPRDTH